VAVWVDDLLIVGKSLPDILVFKSQMSDRFKMTDLGEVTFLLGMKITRDRKAKTLSLSQKSYLEGVLKRYEATNLRPHDTPMVQRLSLEDCPTKLEGDQPTTEIPPYRQAIGSLMYAMLATRPDIAFSISHLSQFSTNPGEEHWKAVQRVLQYILRTLDLSLTFCSSGGVTLQGSCDSDWAGCADTSASTTGYVFSLAAGPIVWNSQKQKTLAASSVEAEYMAASECSKTAVYLRTFMEELGFPQQRPTRISTDSAGSLAVIKQSSSSRKIRHVQLRFHIVRQHVQEKKWTEFYHLRSKELPADILTKPLPRPQHLACVKTLGLRGSFEGECWNPNTATWIVPLAR
jgi:Reverse transcriptase (RNA-dependent DNA polymerase)